MPRTVAITVTDVYAAVTRTSRSTRGTSMHLTSTTTINKPVEQVYAFWSQLDRLPTFMAHLEDVSVTAPGRSHWRAAAPFGRNVEWDAETTEDVPSQRIAWRSLEGADIPNSGEVRFIARARRPWHRGAREPEL